MNVVVFFSLSGKLKKENGGRSAFVAVDSIRILEQHLPFYQPSKMRLQIVIEMHNACCLSHPYPGVSSIDIRSGPRDRFDLWRVAGQRSHRANERARAGHVALDRVIGPGRSLRLPRRVFM